MLTFSIRRKAWESTMVRKMRDASGHEHAADGKFGSGGGGQRVDVTPKGQVSQAPTKSSSRQEPTHKATIEHSKLADGRKATELRVGKYSLRIAEGHNGIIRSIDFRHGDDVDVGHSLLHAAAEHAKKTGKAIASESHVTANEAEMWSALKESGFPVQINAKSVRGGDGAYVPDSAGVPNPKSGSPVFWIDFRQKSKHIPWEGIVTKASNFTGVSFGRYYINGQQVDEGTYKARQKKPETAKPKAGNLHEQIARTPGAQKLGFTLQRLSQMNPEAIKQIADQLGIKENAGQGGEEAKKPKQSPPSLTTGRPGKDTPLVVYDVKGNARGEYQDEKVAAREAAKLGGQYGFKGESQRYSPKKSGSKPTQKPQRPGQDTPMVVYDAKGNPVREFDDENMASMEAAKIGGQYGFKGESRRYPPMAKHNAKQPTPSRVTIGTQGPPIPVKRGAPPLPQRPGAQPPPLPQRQSTAQPPPLPVEKVRSRVREYMQSASKVPAKMKAATQRYVKGKYQKLASRYGHKGAAAILTASIMLLPVPAPGTSFLPIALAEAIVQLKRMLGKSFEGELDQETIDREAQALIDELTAEVGEEGADDGDGGTPQPFSVSFEAKAWEESKHSRGQPGNAGEFGPGGGGKKPSATTEAKTEAGDSKMATQAKAVVKKIKPVKSRAFEGEPTGGKISKQLAGAIGEEIIIQYLHSQGFKDAGQLSGFVGTEKNNLPVDLIHDHRVIEVKTGQSSNSDAAQQWRLTIGEPGEKEKEWLKTASAEAKAKFNAKKQAAIHKRKKEEIAKLGKELGYTVKGNTMTVIINPDTKTADIYEFEGFHDRIGWKSETATSGYIGSVRYG